MTNRLRIKTEDEFTGQYGKIWREPYPGVNAIFVREMDYLFGSPLSIEVSECIGRGREGMVEVPRKYKDRGLNWVIEEWMTIPMEVGINEE